MSQNACVCQSHLSVCVLVSFASQCKTRQRDGCTMRQSTYTCVNSYLPCPQVPLSVQEPADERAGGRLQRLDQLAVSVCPPPVCVVGRACNYKNFFIAYSILFIHIHTYIYIYIYSYSCIYIYMYIYMYVYMYIYLFMYVYVYICIL